MDGVEYMTAKEAAEQWGISMRLVQQYCVDGRIEGATKFSGSWAIPKSSKKPENPRKKQKKRLTPKRKKGESGQFR